ncbi:MAG: transcriptional regulator with XRE-family HTH domain [Arenicella sp.]|jgi:transcriptional regulator with XRE-family HTH domain
MIIKKLRSKKNWSQEQLATFCGVSLRTIQRVEAGNQASLDTLKSLASVFEVDISKLTEEIIVIDKDSAEWKAEPLWLKIGVIGIKKRWHLLLIECFLLLVGVWFWFFEPLHLTTPLPFLFAYLNAKLVAYIDMKGYW